MKRKFTLLAVIVLLLLMKDNIHAQVTYGLFPWDGENNVVSFVKNEISGAWEYSGIAGSTEIQINYGFARNPVDGEYYLIGGTEWQGPTRYLYHLNSSTFAIEEPPIALLVSSNGDIKPNAFAISSSGEFFIAYSNGRIDNFDVNTLQSTAHADVPGYGAAGLTYDFDNDRLLYVTSLGPVELYEIHSAGTVNHLFDFNTPGDYDNCGAQAIAYLGEGVCLASSAYSCDILYTIHLNNQTTELIAQPNGSPLSDLKSLIAPNEIDIIYVTVSGAGVEDGSSWDNAYPGEMLQEAIEQEGIEQVWVAVGTYTPTLYLSEPKSPPVKDGTSSQNHFWLKNNVAVYGGFAGYEESLSERVMKDNPTILSGDIIGDDDYSVFPGDYMEDNVQHVIYLPEGLDLFHSAVLDGFIIEGGIAGEGSQTIPFGGGLYCESNSPLIRNCIFRYNAALGGGGGYIGGEVLDMTFVNCILSKNFSFDNGGGFYVDWGASLTLTNTTVTDNHAAWAGGGIFSIAANVAIHNSIIWGNTAEEEGKQISVIQGGKKGYGINMNYSCYSDGEGDIDDYWEEIEFNNCITQNPLFVNPLNGDYRMIGLSPCVDAGNNVYNNLPFDIRGAGYDRILDKNAAKEAIIDMGAYEYKNGEDPNPNIIFVDKDRPDDSGDGFSWEFAKKTLQGALDIAGAGFQIWVEAGTYTPTYDYGEEGEEQNLYHFRMQNGVAIYGGFAGNEDPEVFDLADRDFEANETILSGDLLGNDEFDVTEGGYQNGTGDDNCYHVFYHPEAYTLDNTAILDGFTIMGGNASSADNNPNYSGGGILNYDNCSPTLTNLKIIANYALLNGGGIANIASFPVIENVEIIGNYADYNGGGIFNNGSSPGMTDVIINGNYSNHNGGGICNNEGDYNNLPSSPNLTNVLIEANYADINGGGMYNNGSSPILNKVDFIDNVAEANGGGICNNQGVFALQPSSPILTDVTIQGNHSTNGGGVYNNNNSAPKFTNTLIHDNQASQNGGGIYNFNSSSPEFNNTIVIDNQAGQNGGGVFNNDDASPVFINTTINRNIAGKSGGGVYTNYYSTATFYNVLITNNEAGLNGGGYFNNQSSETTLTNGTISKNSAGQYGGGAANANEGVVTLNNSIVWGNTATGLEGDYGHEFYVVYDAATTLNYSCYSNEPGDVFVEDGGVKTNTFTATNNNTTNDPLFTDPENNDFIIPRESPCADTGLDDYFDIEEENDIRGVGYPRKVDKNHPNEIGTIDMGAYEFGPQDACFNPDDGGEIGEVQTIPANTQPELLFSISEPLGYYGPLEFKWQFKTELSDWTDIEISGTHTNTYQPDVLTQTTWFRRLAQVGCVSPTWGNPAISNEVKITVSNWPYPWEKCNTSPAANGSSDYNPELNGGTFQLTATGQSTTLNDVYHFVYQDICESKVTVIARLADVENGGWAGVMMRESCSPGAKTILFKTRLYNPNVFIGYRTLDNKAMRNASQVAQLIHWMKIQRNGTNFKVFTSYNGTTWQQRYSVNISMGTCIQAGIFTESVLATRTSVAWFDHADVAKGLKIGEELTTSDNDQAQVELYPNPADDLVTISIPENESEVSYSITDMDGRVIEQSGFTGNEAVLDVSSFKPGLYVIRMEIGGEVVTKRLVVM
ncbi:MAG: T9SS type A sorting domain-containing protein [Bacteroidales bacterium]|nr:T9SS type A sorting domain-containing protein [Bacteroidales bacterium]